MRGFPIDVAARLRKLMKKQLIVAGGIRSQQEVDALDALGADAVVGMAVYTELLAYKKRRERGASQQASRPFAKDAKGWGTERIVSSRLDLFASLADGVAGFDAGRAQQARDLLEMQLHRVGAHDFGLGEIDAGVADRVHARFEIGDVLFEVDALGRLAEAPAVNAAGDEIEAE